MMRALGLSLIVKVSAQLNNRSTETRYRLDLARRAREGETSLYVLCLF
jgi:hypothetical protein